MLLHRCGAGAASNDQELVVVCMIILVHCIVYNHSYNLAFMHTSLSTSHFYSLFCIN